MERSTVRGPAIIGAGSRITDSFIGPYTAIDKDVSITRSEVEHSIILGGSSISDLTARLESSLLGRDVRICRREGTTKTLKLLIGDNADLEIP